MKIETKLKTKQNLDLAGETKLFEIKFSEYKIKRELFASQLKIQKTEGDQHSQDKPTCHVSATLLQNTVYKVN